MYSIDLGKTVSQLSGDIPAFVPVFQKLKIDTRYSANLLLPEVCSNQGLELQNLLRELEGVLRESKFLDDKILGDYGIPELIGYVLFTHHAYLEKELPRLQELLGNAILEDGHSHPELMELAPVFKKFKDSILLHIQEEEKHLFPFFLLMVGTGTPSPALDEEGLDNLVQVVEKEDEDIRSNLEKLQKKIESYQIPKEAGKAYRDLFNDLKRLEIELQRHIRVENQFLFPKVLAAEIELSRREEELTKSS